MLPFCVGLKHNSNTSLSAFPQAVKQLPLHTADVYLLTDQIQHSFQACIIKYSGPQGLSDVRKGLLLGDIGYGVKKPSGLASLVLYSTRNSTQLIPYSILHYYT